LAPVANCTPPDQTCGSAANASAKIAVWPGTLKRVNALLVVQRDNSPLGRNPCYQGVWKKSVLLMEVEAEAVEMCAVSCRSG
jgi:hypothetical protein